MTNVAGSLTEASETVGRRVGEVRRDLGWSVEQLAERCAQAGAPQLTVNALYVIESGRKEKATGRRRRHVTVDELLLLAVALGVAPVDLLVPSTVADDAPVNVAPEVTTTAGAAREWIGGGLLKTAPQSLAELAEAIRFMPKARAEAASVEWFRRHGAEYMLRANKAWEAEQADLQDVDDWWLNAPEQGQDHDK
jgi:transcriptional regulator with XRE-family HTH domain